MSNKRKSNNNLILRKADLVLLKNSEEAKNTEIYGNLYESLKPYITLSPNDLKQDIVFDDKARMTLLHNVKTMMDRIQGEWYAKTSFRIATTEVHCQLCGAKNTYVCYIVNRYNGTELHVGRKCVTYYKDINGADVVISKINTYERDLKKEARRSNFDVALGNDIDFTKISEHKIETFPVLLPYKLHADLKKAITDCNRIRTSYISTGGDLEECIEKFNLKKAEFENLYKRAETHYLQNKNNPLVCTRIIANWLKDNYPNVVEKIQKSNGILNEDTLQYVHEPNFIKSNLSLFENSIKNKDVSFLNINGSVMRFKIQNDRFVYPIYFIVPIRTFMKNIGCRCLTQNGYRFDKVNLSPSIENNPLNINNVLNYIISILSNTGYTIILEERTSQFYWEKKHTIHNKWSTHERTTEPLYKIATIDTILSIMSKVLLDDEKSKSEISKIIISNIRISGKWIKKEEKDRNVQIASEAAGMQKQKEFTPYL